MAPYDIMSVSFAGTILLASQMFALCLTRPNGLNSEVDSEDKLLGDPRYRAQVDHFFVLAKTVMYLTSAYYVVIVLLYPDVSPMICPNKADLHTTLLGWNAYTATCLAIFIAGASLRILAFAQLGENFTFELKKPSSLYRSVPRSGNQC